MLKRIVLTLDYWTDLPATGNQSPGLSAHELRYTNQGEFTLLKDFRFGLCYRTATHHDSLPTQQQHSPVYPVKIAEDFPLTSEIFWQLMWHSWKPRKLAEFSWRLHQNGLAIGRRLRYLLPADAHDTLLCTHCLCLQTAEHLFVDCPQMQPPLRKLLAIANRIWPTLRLKQLPWTQRDFVSMGFVAQSPHFAAWNLLHSNFLYEIWKSFNSSTHHVMV